MHMGQRLDKRLEEEIEAMSAELEEMVFYSVEKEALDCADLNRLNKLRLDYWEKIGRLKMLRERCGE